MADASRLPHGSEARGWPDNVGIVAMEVYFPPLCVNQTELETFDGASAGKYTIGLGQKNMGFCTDREDIHSLALTVVQGLMEKRKISFAEIGRLEVGTETIVDKSKSVKTVLMQLFAASGNMEVDGLDTTNACYGGTQALFNAAAWVESSAWDGRYALVVAADIAVYASGNARPTGGAGAVAMLIGPNAPIVLERGLRAIHMDHAYDFYKPNLSSEFPVVDGKYSIECYINAVDRCYQRLLERMQRKAQLSRRCAVEDIDYFCFHTPFTKMVQKSFARLVLNDFVNDPDPDTSRGKYAGLEACKGRTLQDTIGDREVEKAFMKASLDLFRERTGPSLLLGQEVGNMYTASLYGALASLLSCKPSSELVGKRVAMFSYGSGYASAMYCLRLSNDASPDSSLNQLLGDLSFISKRLAERKTVSPAEFEKIMKLRENVHNKPSYTPVSSTDDFCPGVFYLSSVDDKYRRSYSRVPP